MITALIFFGLFVTWIVTANYLEKWLGKEAERFIFFSILGALVIVNSVLHPTYFIGLCAGVVLFAIAHQVMEILSRRRIRKRRKRANRRDGYEVIHAALGYLLDEGHAADIGGYGPTWVQDKTGVTEAELEMAVRQLSERGYL